MFNKISLDAFSYQNIFAPLLTTIRKGFRSIVLPRKYIYQYLDILLTKLKQGQDLSGAIKTIEKKKQEHYPKKHRAIKKFYSTIRVNWETSEEPHLADVMEDYLTDIELMILRSSDKSSEAIEMILENNEKSSSNIKILIFASISPFIYILSFIGLVNGSHGDVIEPIVRTISQTGQVPVGELAALISVHELVLNNQSLFIPFLIIVVLTYKITFELFTHPSRIFVEKILIIGLPYSIHRANASVAFLQTMATLTRSGYPMAGVLKTIIEHGSPFTRYEGKQIESNFLITGQISESLNTSLFSVETNYLLSVYLETKTPAKYMESIAEKIAQSVTTRITYISWAINLTGMILISAYIILLVLANFSISTYLT
ncbi:type II secretion system F family protein [Aliivibrio finisterrensis]|uniref:Bacterial type II secretion system protein F domain protein n=1 Tax=Aliivibrio finisterrensis TaxID=511998 RepID=A0ABY0I4W9_9GAMM|nr:type II secretion system F family protein [Aliivibrio finisterrensis]RYU63820.1 bacterial type II secretion system protein F domain protein [Aliivibrio finisterrensis]RYU82757.1 bacterial type II secretion system protein F domain protein [Aliivibrio finisterrensis]